MIGRTWLALLLAAGLVLLALGAYAVATRLQGGAEATALSPEDAVREYLSFMEAGKLERVLDQVTDGTDVGMDPDPGSAEGMPLDEAEARGLVRPLSQAEARRIALAILARQRQFVVEEFGPGAWGGASFTLQKTHGPPYRTAWLDSTGQEVEEQTALALLDRFWEDVAEIEGINPGTVLGLADAVPPGMTPEEVTALRARAREVFTRYQHQIPVRIEQLPVAETYLVRFSFGIGVSGSGVSGFVAFLSSHAGGWRLRGFQWEPVCIPPEGDI